MTEISENHMFWNLGLADDELSSMIVSFKKNDVTNVVSEMYHVILYEYDTNKNDGKPSLTMNVVCRLLDAKYYAENLMKTMKNSLGFICSKHDTSADFILSLLKTIEERTDLLWNFVENDIKK